MNNPYMELAAAISDREDWRDQAACNGAPDPDLWFTDGHDEQANRRKLRESRAICRACPVRIQCLDWATSTQQSFGVWGGKNLSAGRRSHMAERTHCKNRHEFTPENTVMDVNGRGVEFRRCLACTKVHNARSEANRKAKPKSDMSSNFQGSLGERRRRVAQMTRQGMSSTEIARRLNVDARTVLRDRQAMS